MSEPYVLGIGAANIDVHGKSRVPIVMRDSNPGHLRTSAGGVTRNVLENLARLGVRTKLISAVGADLYGEMVLRSSASAGIDISGVVTVPGAASSCYISVLDQKGDMLVAMSDMGILENVTPELVHSHGDELLAAESVVCDPCLPVETIEAIISEAGDTPVFLDPVSTSYARKVRHLVGGLSCIKPNRIELGVLADMDTDTPERVEALRRAAREGRAPRRRQPGRARLLLRGRGGPAHPARTAARGDHGQRQRRGRRLHGRARLRQRERPGRGREHQLRPRRGRALGLQRANHQPRDVRRERPEPFGGERTLKWADST